MKWAWLSALLLSACASFSNYESSEITMQEMQAVAVDASALMAEKYPAGKTSLAMNERLGNFGEIFKEQLRQKGFALADDGFKLHYTLDVLDTDFVRLGLLMHDWRADIRYQRTDNSIKRLNLTQRLSYE